jgi:hypothetical protein
MKGTSMYFCWKENLLGAVDWAATGRGAKATDKKQRARGRRPKVLRREVVFIGRIRD